MKVRFGVGLGSETDPAEFAAIVDRLESGGVDSLWLSELVYTKSVDPVVGMAFALSRTTRLKVGTSVAILPGRHPVLVAKQLSSLAALAPKRVLPVFGLQPARRDERELFPAPEGKRGKVFDESLELLRSALRDDEIAFEGEYFTVGPVTSGLRQDRPLDIWLGGSAPAAFRRIGRFGDGWLGSFLTPAEAGEGRKAIIAAADEAGREIEADHFGISLVLAEDGIPDALADSVLRRRPGADLGDLVAGSWKDLHRLIDGYLEAGLTKFVVGSVGGRPTEHFLDRFTEELLPRQN
ncbi:putative F420-dependent oxidoreductase [Nocardia transvalensis]|uniref:Putative F420-dependent oxidoreductase n=1 Tax=Nocardia transvalensis TaxID=37333 RepID=A0A7W9ULY5_9NOCA|nr:TIGR03854 family LLM class F420-dependent oxidoreductase [Nocardia transvalensis]MBB5918049.1 putative F420-dependent oxidoreductase [Nocardia transvalensis]